MGLQSKKSPVVRLQLLPCSSLAGPAAQKPQAVRLQLLPCSSLAGPAATKISSTQNAVAILQLSYWACHQKNPEKSDCSYYPAALLLGLPRKNPKYGQIAVAIAAFLILNGPAVQKISSSQIAVATLQLFCWACCLKNLKYADCSCSAASNNFEIDDIHNQIRANQHCL